jgi:hypothetical protein
MKIFLKSLLSISVLFVTAVFISGCINVIQKVKLNEDGSGTINIRYWTKSSDIIGDGLSGFGFSDERVKSNYTSSNSEPSDIRIEKNATADSLSVVTLNLMFKDINKLSQASAFKNIKADIVDGNEGKEFKYVLLRDTANSKGLEMNKYILYHEFEFPGEVIYTNGKANASENKTFWKNTIADLINDIEMTATFKLK